MKIKPLHDRVIVKRIDEEEKTKGGIIIPDTAKEKPQEGKIVAVGKGKVLENGSVQSLEVKVGDKVLYGKYSGNEKTEKYRLRIFADEPALYHDTGNGGRCRQSVYTEGSLPLSLR